MNRNVTLFIFILQIFFLSLPAWSATIYVPGDSTTIQAGIDGAIDGDTVLVADGTYTGNGNRDIDFIGKKVVLKSENGSEFTIIDCESNQLNPHRGFFFHNGEDSTAIVEGFTIRGGYGVYDSNFGGYIGGGIKCDSASSPTILNCILTGNVATVGGGIFCLNSNPRIINNVLNGNGANLGGGIYCDNSNPYISNNTISLNAANFGSGVFCYFSDPIISNNIIIENTSGGNGGGLYCDNSSPTIDSNTISYNSANSNGGGIYCASSNPLIINNIISENTNGSRGGGICCENSTPIISNNSITGNSSLEGGGISFYQSNFSISNNTITGNGASFGGGIYSLYSEPTINSSTICGNSADSTGGGIYISNSVLTLTNTIVWSNEALVNPEIYIDTGAPVITYCDISTGWEGEGNIDYYPVFVDPVNGNYQVCSQSPCIDAGDSTMQDPDGTRINIGVYNSSPPDCPTGNNWYVATNGSDVTGDGLLGNPFETIQHAIDVSFYNDTVIVLNGTYAENINFDGKIGKDIILASNFIFSGDTLDVQNTILDGALISTVVTFELCNNLAAITGFTITNGNSIKGGGIYCLLSYPIISDNIITGNISGVGSFGGGIYCENSNPTIMNTVINGNAANQGGGIYCELSNPIIDNANISNNSAGFFGGGIYCNSSNPSITSTVIGGNSAVYLGGGIYCQASSPVIINNTISDNSVNFSGGGIYCENNSNLTLENCIVAFNTANLAAIFCSDTSNAVLICSNVYGNDGGNWVNCLASQANTNGNFSTDPFFCYTSGGLYNLKPTSQCAAVNNSCGVLIGALPVGCLTCCIGIRGNIDFDVLDQIDIADLVYLVHYSFGNPSGPQPPCYDEADIDGSLGLDIGDIVYMVSYMFGTPSGPPPIGCP